MDAAAARVMQRLQELGLLKAGMEPGRYPPVDVPAATWNREDRLVQGRSTNFAPLLKKLMLEQFMSQYARPGVTPKGDWINKLMRDVPYAR